MRIAFVIPGDIDLRTGGYAYDRRVLAELRQAGVAIDHVRLPGSFPHPTPADLALTARTLAALPADTVLLIDGLAYGAFPEHMAKAIRQPIVALVHHPLALEEGLDRDQQRTLAALERNALTFARRVVVTSPATARTLTAEFDVPEHLIRVAVPGTDAAPRASGTGEPLQLLTVGSIVPRKATHLLVRALALCQAGPWRLDIVGAARSSAAEIDLTTAIRETGLGAQITLAGSLAERDINACYDRADLFVLPSLYEGFGMVLTEAVARGLPIICTTGGAAAETVPDAAALKVPPGNVPALSAALDIAMSDHARRRAMADAAWQAAKCLQRWDETARVVAAAVMEAVRS